MSYKNITVLVERESRTLEIAEIAIERCESETGWGVMTLGGADPINAGETTDLLGWGELDGPAVIHKGYRIPAAKLA